MTEERFDIFDEELRPIGTAPRSEVHAKGYWHRTFHCWIVRREDDRLFIRFQKRQAGKDSYPDCYDITVAGHLAAGETVRDAVREIEEEIGLAAAFEEIVPLGEYRGESIGEAGGTPFIDREVSHVFGWLCGAPLTRFRLQPEEVAGVYEADARRLIALFTREEASVEAAGLELAADGRMLPVRRAVTASDFVPRAPSYYAGIFRALCGHYLV
ncbi:NUDIX hydrolase [Paenibacillus darwinianus]|uniref:NUDIX hydrolase n=1 Tax=Paenibacillus darwinianus TaxID=1380763 RepID=A0A9W5RZE1_9BACL|nr:NUDIX hydrolase [Paenibacillus darwinianus]EXX86117.1 NUDIX hydrolase [Paenibacillus darwinianus]EXX86218.1 NUDIX hydrolase [Paenibacillus darwinianus]